MEDDFLRLYLFNNTTVRLKFNELDGIINFKEANNLLLTIITCSKAPSMERWSLNHGISKENSHTSIQSSRIRISKTNLTTP